MPVTSTADRYIHPLIRLFHIECLYTHLTDCAQLKRKKTGRVQRKSLTTQRDNTKHDCKRNTFPVGFNYPDRFDFFHQSFKPSLCLLLRICNHTLPGIVQDYTCLKPSLAGIEPASTLNTFVSLLLLQTVNG